MRRPDPPARGYRWADAEPGNELATKHGAYSPRKVDPLAAELVDATVAAALEPGSPTAYLAEPAYRPSIHAWARCEARVQLVTEWLIDQGGDLDAAGEVRTAADLLTRLDSQALRHRERLGLDPLARARLGRDVAAGSIDMAKLMAAIATDEKATDDPASGVVDTTATEDGRVDGDET